MALLSEKLGCCRTRGADGQAVASSQEKLVPSSISSNVSSTCSDISTTAAFTDLSQLSSSSSSSSSSSDGSSSDDDTHGHGADDESTCETRTLRDEQATPIMEPQHMYMSHPRFVNQTQVGDYELVQDNSTLEPSSHLATTTTPPHSPSTPDLLYPHTHLTASAVNLPINQNGLPVFETNNGRCGGAGDLDLDLERQQALFYSDALNSNVLDETLSNVGSADHLIHGGHGNFLSVNQSRTFLQGIVLSFLLGNQPCPVEKLYYFYSSSRGLKRTQFPFARAARNH